MTKKLNMAFLEYVLEHQNNKDNYLNRFFVLKHRMEIEQSFAKKKIERARNELEKAGLIINLGSGIIHITDEGKQFFHENSQIKLYTLLERFTFRFNKKWIAILSIVTLIISLCGLFFNKNDSMITIIQNIAVKFKSEVTTQQVVLIDKS
ncbi:hypothetical protein [Legionella tucsonensis]|uniref:Uncharacterized protein n=1 Tax=Legionella tucsonensis TaxID=40335 RepID=A0A0W0ZY46_9GAMM|nr:hypothetical protein [Legionella tucsonensis]KTD73990.1 hypothetical protein Ltuc_1837 [Legionella tucsonensis]